MSLRYADAQEAEMTRELELIDTLLSEGRDEFTFEDAKAIKKHKIAMLQ